MIDSESNWRTAPAGRVSSSVFSFVRQIDRQQFEIFNRFRQLESLYDTGPRPSSRMPIDRGRGRGSDRNNGRMHENVVASNADTVAAQIAVTDVRAAFDTDDADWSTQRRAKHLEWYCEGLDKLLTVQRKCRHAFKAGAVMKGTAVMKVVANEYDQATAEPVMVDDIVVDDLESRFRDPRQLHHRTCLDRDDLMARFPEKASQIKAAQTTGNWATWAGWRPIGRSEVLVIESWSLPLGVKGHPRYKPGRHTLCADGIDLVDEVFEDESFPFAIMRWSRPTNGSWYGIGMAERIAGIQLALNRRNLQMERKLDHGAYPTTWVSQADAQLAMTQATISQNTYGTVGVYRGAQPPTTVTPPAISPDELNDAERLSGKASQVSGVSRMASQSMKPAGIETGVALREYRDQTTQRFAEQEKDYEQFVLDVFTLLIRVCKQLGDKAPTIVRKNRWGSRTIPWAKVDMGEVKVWIGAAATISRTRAGRLQTVIEWAQAGVISQDDAKRLMDHPDLERAMSLYNAAIENVESCLEEIADGSTITPEPFMNLKLLVWRGQQQYLNWSTIGAPELVLERLRATVVTAAWMAAGGSAANTNSPSAAVGPDMTGAPPAGVGPATPGAPPMPQGIPPLPGIPPGVAPVAALSPQAMQLMPTG